MTDKNKYSLLEEKLEYEMESKTQRKGEVNDTERLNIGRELQDNVNPVTISADDSFRLNIFRIEQEQLKNRVMHAAASSPIFVSQTGKTYLATSKYPVHEA